MIRLYYCYGCCETPDPVGRHRDEPACETCAAFARDAGLTMDQVFLFRLFCRDHFNPAALD